ncbi:DUF4230 domain-containing protein [Rossellomorea vietnamensis]|uniref:DUF4230 domain-containing protein n=1 Tax=Rossellomorea vietnamensis TaxID=218284 RepID=A0A0P6VY46_9BACI|nr:DUF4230 domain-containing protein [Rossellomorea vietnamensis]KPL57998.1 hypothetical protein AM506_18885 [Rossellomorea vietnamensis]
MTSQYKKIREMEAILADLKETERQTGASLAIENRRSRRRGRGLIQTLLAFWKRRVVIFLVVFLLVAGAAAIGVNSWLSGSTFTEEKGSFVERIQEMSSLATAQGFVKAVIEQEDNQLFGKEINADLPGTKRKLLMVVPGTVLAGVDLQEIDDKDIVVNEEKKEIRLTLPRAEILQEPSIDTDNIKTFSVEGIFRNDVDWNEGFALAEVAKDQISQEAVEQGILQAAEKNAEKSLKGFFEQLGYDVTIEFQN